MSSSLTDHAKPTRRRQTHSIVSKTIKSESSHHTLHAGVFLISGGPTIRGSRSIIAVRSFAPLEDTAAGLAGDPAQAGRGQASGSAARSDRR